MSGASTTVKTTVRTAAVRTAAVQTTAVQTTAVKSNGPTPTPSAAPLVRLLYRGVLASCNYDCPYCPFAKHRSPPEELAQDEAELRRFVAWALRQRAHRLGVFFTPWGEALVRRWYRDAIVSLSHAAHVERVAVQTNLSAALDWLAESAPAKVGLWVTFHPRETSRARFATRLDALARLGVHYSVGIVGTREHLEDARWLRGVVPRGVYVWVNAYKSAGPGYYDRDLVEAYSSIDPLFPLNGVRHASRGRACATGERVLSVSGSGALRRCFFVEEELGNLYAAADPRADADVDSQRLDAVLRRRPCPNETCSCHIGYVHLEELRLAEVFGAGILERVPGNISAGGDLGASLELPSLAELRAQRRLPLWR